MVELILAIAVFIAFFLAVLDVWPLSARAAHQGKNVLLASQIAQEQMELALYRVQESFAADQSVPPTPVTFTGTHNGVSQTLAFTYTVSAPASSTNPRDILVTVEWREPGAAGSTTTRAVRLETLVADPR